MIRISGPSFDDLDDQIEAAERLVDAITARIMDHVAVELGRVTVAAGEPPPEPPGEPLVSLDSLAVIATLWATEVAGELAPFIKGIWEYAAAKTRSLLTGAVPPERADQIPDVDAPNTQSLAEAYLADAPHRVSGFSDEMWTVARAQLLEGFMKGESIDALRDRLRITVPELTAARARTIARTEVISASNAGSLSMVELGEFTGTKSWLATEDARTRPTHHLADGQTVPLAEAFTVGGFPLFFPGDPAGPLQEIVNCVVGSTHVAWPGQEVNASTRRSYSGPLFKLFTADGHILAVTPNHPILTGDGYRLAQALRPGDQVLTTGDAGLPEVANVPPMAEEFHRALSQSGVTSRVEAGGVNFHGDVPDSEVDVVRPHGNLRLELAPQPGGHLGKQVLAGEDNTEVGFLSLGNADVLREDDSAFTWSLLPASGDIGRSSKSPAVSWGEAFHAEAVGFTAASHLQPQGFESANDEGSTDPEFIRHTKHALALGMTFSEIIDIQIDPSAHVDVYNLSTSEGWYIANGIACHNCRCTTTYDLNDAPLTAAGGAMAGEWIGVLTLEGTPTGDGRMFAPDALTWADLPLPLLWQRETGDGHDGSVIVGDIREISRMGAQIIGRGTFDLSTPEGAEAAKRVGSGYLKGVSVDADSLSVEYVYQETDEGELVVSMAIFHEGRLRGATLCAIPAFAEAFIQMVPEAPLMEMDMGMMGGTVTTASGGTLGQVIMAEHVLQAAEDKPLTAAAYVLTIPDVPPAAWFEEPWDVEIHGALTVTDEGRVYGYLAPAGVAHRSFSERVTVPMGNVDYSLFMGRETLTAGGGRVVTGALTMDCGHASTGYRDPAMAMDHYDNACSIVATVRIGENAKGVWVAGALVPGLSANQVSRIMACQLSGDWRPHRERSGWREFAGALLVPVPGFAMARTEASVKVDDYGLVASAVPVTFQESHSECSCKTSASDLSAQLEALASGLGLGLSERMDTLCKAVLQTGE